MVKKIMKSDKGFTLVEIIIAIAVLAIIIIPVMRLFSGSFNMNIISRRRMNATVVAEDLMESVKANDAEALAYKFSYPIVADAETGADVNKFDIIRNSMIPDFTDEYVTPLKKTGERSYEAMAANATGSSIESSDDGTHYTFKNSADGKYYYYVHSITNNGTKEEYDALISVDASFYRKNGGAIEEYNAQELVDVATVKGDGTASYMINSTQEEPILDALQSKGNLAYGASYPGLTNDNLFRTFNFKITKTGSIETVVLDYEYAAKVTGYDDMIITDSVDLYQGNADAIPFENLFFFYTPNYYSKAGNIHDVINVENINDVKCNVYIVKQETTSATSLQIAESLYKVTVSVKESTMKDESDTRIRTNIDTNLAAAYIESLSPDILQGNFVYNNISGMKDRLVTSLANATSKDRYYDVSVKIYKSEDVSSLTFPEDKDVIYELKGTTQE